MTCNGPSGPRAYHDTFFIRTRDVLLQTLIVLTSSISEKNRKSLLQRIKAPGAYGAASSFFFLSIAGIGVELHVRYVAFVPSVGRALARGSQRQVPLRFAVNNA